LARAAYSRRSLFLLDDVFSGMDAHTVEAVSRALLGSEGLLRNDNTTVILVTHHGKSKHASYGLTRMISNRDIDKPVTFADQVIVLDNGQITESGSPSEVLQRHPTIDSLGLTSIEPGTTGDISGTVYPPDDLVISSDDVSEPNEAHVDSRRKNGDISVYKYYLASSGYKTICAYTATMIVWMFCTEFPCKSANHPRLGHGY
jgi:ATP-binding cassette subfamily C (CFTR/MRP) protein 1